jgi:protein subunit release factor B
MSYDFNSKQKGSHTERHNTDPGQTGQAFLKFVPMMSPGKMNQIESEMIRLGVHDHDLREEFIRGSGSGGQKINKTNSCVQLTHTPTNIVIKCQSSRSREDNRWMARRLLCERLSDIREGIQSERQKKIHKIRAQKRKRSKRAKEKLLADKKHRGRIKQHRRSGHSID